MSNLKYEVLVAKPIEKLGAGRAAAGPSHAPQASPNKSMDESFDESDISDLLSDEEEEVKSIGQKLEAEAAYKVPVKKPAPAPREIENYFDRLELNERNKLRRDLVEFQIKRSRVAFMAKGIVEEIENMNQEEEVLAVARATAVQSAFDEEDEEEY